MPNESFIEKLASAFGQTASVKNVFGEPIQVHNKTIIPVAKIAYGLGGGYGQGRKKKRPGEQDINVANESPEGEGAGGGGGIRVMSKGVYEITPTCTRFIPANSAKQIFLGVALGFVLKTLLFSKRHCR